MKNFVNLKKFFFRFWQKKLDNNPLDLGKEFFKDGFNEEEKSQIVNSALTTSCQILMSAMVMTNSHNYITGDCLFPDGTKWTLRFERVEPND